MINWSLSRKKTLQGKVQVDRSTKTLLQRLRPGTVAVIAHDDLDELSAYGLMRANAKAVINAGRTMTGQIASHAVSLLLDRGIPLFEIERSDFAAFRENDEIIITSHGIALPSAWIPSNRIGKEDWLKAYEAAKAAESLSLAEFVDNTLRHAEMEKSYMLEPVRVHGLQTRFEGKPVVIVARGRSYQADLACLQPYISGAKPVLVGVDGGADALLEQGCNPDLIVGDMDSVSDRALQSGAELIVHGYRDGRAPGLARLAKLGLEAKIVAAGGTSEDLALLLAYDGHCERIVTVGLHSHLYDFLEKGRKGMGSTWLVLMKVGSRLIDARGLSQLSPFMANYGWDSLGKPQESRRAATLSLLERCRASLFQRKGRKLHGAAHIGHHSRLE